MALSPKNRPINNAVPEGFLSQDSDGVHAPNIGYDADVKKVQLNPQDFTFDKDLLGCRYGTVFNMYETVDFFPDVDGAIWFNKTIPPYFSEAKDIFLNMKFVLPVWQNMKFVKLDFDVWVLNPGDSIESAGHFSATESLGSEINQNSKLIDHDLTAIKIPETLLSASSVSFAFKLRRNNMVNNNYPGDFKLLSVVLFQEH